jgi:CBS domain containing-hemolysin-like protein
LGELVVGFFQYYLQMWWSDIQAFFAFDATRLSEPDMIARLVLQVLLLVGSAFFSSSETALFSLSRLDLQNLRKARHPRSDTLHELLDQPRRLIISILCGNELVNIAASANMAGILVVLYGDGEQAGLINILVMVPMLLLLGEVTPKTIAVSIPVRYSAWISTPLALWVRLVTPLRWVLRGVSDRLTTMIVGEPKTRENLLQVDEFRSLVEDVAEEGILDATERALIYNLLEAGDTEIVEIMVPRTQVHFLNVEMPVLELIETFRRYQHPRVPIYKDHHDNVVGFLHSEDVVRLVLDGVDLSTLEPSEIMRPAVMVPLTKRVDEMFGFFQNHNSRAAVVLNEFGGVEGFVTVKDVLTFIFGEITGDIEGRELYREQDENEYIVPGDMKLADFNNLTNFGIEDPRMTTIGGVLFRHLDAMPKVGDYVSIEGFDLSVLEMDGHRIAEVQARKGVLGDDDIEATTEDREAAAPAVTDSFPALPASRLDGGIHQAEVLALPTRSGQSSNVEAGKQTGQHGRDDVEQPAGVDVDQRGGQGQ